MTFIFCINSKKYLSVFASFLFNITKTFLNLISIMSKHIIFTAAKRYIPFTPPLHFILFFPFLFLPPLINLSTQLSLIKFSVKSGRIGYSHFFSCFLVLVPFQFLFYAKLISYLHCNLLGDLLYVYTYKFLYVLFSNIRLFFTKVCDFTEFSQSCPTHLILLVADIRRFAVSHSISKLPPKIYHVFFIF